LLSLAAGRASLDSLSNTVQNLCENAKTACFSHAARVATFSQRNSHILSGREDGSHVVPDVQNVPIAPALVLPFRFVSDLLSVLFSVSLRVLFTACIRMCTMPLYRICGRHHVAGQACRLATSALMAVGICGAAIVHAADDAPPAADTALPAPSAEPAAPAAPAFTPEDISIGEPISLPFATPLASPAPVRPPMPPAAPAGGIPVPPTAAQLPSVVAPANPAGPFQRSNPSPPMPVDGSASLDSAAAGTGWLGIAVDDTVVTGRLVVVEVAPDGPAARAGVRPQDMLLAINGNHLQTGDELAAALAAIVPGQRVKMAVGRENRVEDVEALAAPRPPAALSRDWQSATNNPLAAPLAPPAMSPAMSPAAPPELPVPSRLAPEAASVVALPAPAAVMPTPPTIPSRLPAASLPNRDATGSLQQPRPMEAIATPGGRTALGVRTVPVDPAVQSRFRLSDAQGAFVIGVVQDLPASKAGVPPGSVIVAINHQPVRSPQDLTQLVARGPVGTPVPLNYVLPGGQSKQADVVLQSLEQPLERALVGGDEAGKTVEPPATLQPTPVTTRRVQPAAATRATEPEPLARMEELLRRMSNRLEQIERRLERFEPGR
jgi:membrane-associated protease RseP (regulator of RpoE activity)